MTLVFTLPAGVTALAGFLLYALFHRQQDVFFRNYVEFYSVINQFYFLFSCAWIFMCIAGYVIKHPGVDKRKRRPV